MSTFFRYRLAHQDSLLGVAYFSPEPVEPMSLEQCLEHVRRLPNDEFMRGHVRPLLAALGEAELRALFAAGEAVIQALILETALLTPALTPLWEELRTAAPVLAVQTPQVFLASATSSDHDLHAAVSQALAANIFKHHALPDLPDLSDPGPELRRTDPARVRASLEATVPCPRRPAAETHALAMERLYGLAFLDGPEMRHHASLAPWGLQRRWRLDRTTRHGAFNFRLDGVMTSYGRGLTLDEARASLAMEIVERYSSFADIRDGRISGSRDGGEIRVGRWSELGDAALDPNRFQLEVPYRDQPLHWLEGADRYGRPVLAPVQSVYLFTNLDEIRLFSGLGSTGLASGNTPEEAKVSGLLEVLERDSEAVSPFDPERCFRVTSQDPELAALLESYQSQGVDPIFQDLTSDLGVPCYKCFVFLAGGGLVKATGASLSGRRAAISALTETPFPYPQGPASAPGPDGLPVRALENLLDHSTGSASGDLALLEAILEDRGYTPVYADLTKRELRLPVYRAIVPGLEIVADFDRFTRINPRIWRGVLKARGKDGLRPDRE